MSAPSERKWLACWTTQRVVEECPVGEFWVRASEAEEIHAVLGELLAAIEEHRSARDAFDTIISKNDFRAADYDRTLAAREVSRLYLKSAVAAARAALAETGGSDAT